MNQKPPANPPPTGQAPAPTVELEAILRGSQEVAIAHNGRIYRLRKTRNGKLILT